MARYNHRDRIRTVCQSDRSHSGRPADFLCKLTIRSGRPAGNASEFPPHILLKRRSLRLHRQFVNRGKLACKIPRKHFRRIEMAMGCFQPVSALPVTAFQPAMQAGFMISPVHGAQVPFPVCNNLQPPNRSIKMIEKQVHSQLHPGSFLILTSVRSCAPETVH
jgi:hypothetical protein